MSTSHNYIAIDLGAESGRVMLGTVSSEGIALKELHRFANLPVRLGQAIHWDLLGLWREIQIGIAKATAEQPRIAGIGIDTWGVDFALLDEAGELIGNPHHYRDPRTEGMKEKIFGKIAKEKVYAITGIQNTFFNTLFQLSALSFGPHRGQLDRAKTFLFLPDLLAYWLTGQKNIEYTIASTSQLLDARTRQFSPEILAALNLPAAMFPAVRMPATRQSLLGTVQASVGDALHATGIPVFAVGSHDTASAVAAVPAVGNEWLYLSSGTWSLLGAELDQPILTTQAATYDLTNEGGVGNKIRLLKNIGGLWLLQECKRAWALQGQDYDYATLVSLAEGTASSGTIIDPDDAPFGQPGEMPQKIVAYCQRTGQTSPGSPGEFTRVILESLAATYQKVRLMLEDLAGKRFTALHIVGGGSRNGLLNQLAADATGLTVHAGPVEATALGNILAQATATGQVESLAAARALVGRSEAITTYRPRS